MTPVGPLAIMGEPGVAGVSSFRRASTDVPANRRRRRNVFICPRAADGPRAQAYGVASSPRDLEKLRLIVVLDVALVWRVPAPMHDGSLAVRFGDGHFEQDLARVVHRPRYPAQMQFIARLQNDRATIVVLRDARSTRDSQFVALL